MNNLEKCRLTMQAYEKKTDEGVGMTQFYQKCYWENLQKLLYS